LDVNAPPVNLWCVSATEGSARPFQERPGGATDMKANIRKRRLWNAPPNSSTSAATPHHDNDIPSFVF
jgi:hypothetical protein